MVVVRGLHCGCDTLTGPPGASGHLCLPLFSLALLHASGGQPQSPVDTYVIGWSPSLCSGPSAPAQCLCALRTPPHGAGRVKAARWEATGLPGLATNLHLQRLHLSVMKQHAALYRCHPAFLCSAPCCPVLPFAAHLLCAR